MKFAKLKTNIIDWLKSISIDNIKEISPEKVFKNYKPLDRGNSKLATNILSFSLLPLVTCKFYCQGCYDVRSMRYTSVRAKRYLNTSMAIHNQNKLANMIIKQIVNSRTCEFVRIHVGGDFFNESYIAMWQYIVGCVHVEKPNIKFYTYTKTEYTEKLKSIGINVVKSKYKDHFNFSSLENVQQMAEKYNGFICPATMGKVPNGFCGSKCKACMTRENVFFVEH